MRNGAAVAPPPGHQAGQCPGTDGGIIPRPVNGQGHRIARQIGQMGAGRSPIGVRCVDTRQLEGGVGQVQLAVGQLPNGVECEPGLDDRVAHVAGVSSTDRATGSGTYKVAPLFPHS